MMRAPIATQTTSNTQSNHFSAQIMTCGHDHRFSLLAIAVVVILQSFQVDAFTTTVVVQRPSCSTAAVARAPRYVSNHRFAPLSTLLSSCSARGTTSTASGRRYSVGPSSKWARVCQGTKSSQSCLSASAAASADDGDNARPLHTRSRSRNPIIAAYFSFYELLDRITSLPAVIQFVLTMALYMIHLVVLTQHAVTFSHQVFAASHSLTGVGWDSIAGMVSLFLYVCRPRTSNVVASASSSTEAAAGPVSTTPTTTTTAATPQLKAQDNKFPWRLPSTNPRHRLSFFASCAVLTQAYFGTGRFSLLWEDTLFSASAAGWPITAPMHRSLTVLLGHLSWVVAGSIILWLLPRPPRFFQSQKSKAVSLEMAIEPSVIEDKDAAAPTETPFVWFQSRVFKSKWLWWVIGGYLVSSWFFNIADQINQWVLPAQVLMQAQESVVTQLVNPEHNDFAASVVGYIAPCLTAPVWEEVLYRGFALAGLTSFLGGKFHVAAVVQAVIFSAHHMSITAALPLAVLGWTWAMLYARSHNLFSVIFVHALWNSRVFLGSWLGL